MQWATKQKGFTIVELLIVVVVIAILAAITIVAYNGITQRARDSVAKNAISQAQRKLATYSIDNGEAYPSDLTGLGLNTAGNTKYQFTSNNSTTPRGYCITVTIDGISYRFGNNFTDPDNSANTVNDPQAVNSICPGHTTTGDPMITNFAGNPSVEVPGLNGLGQPNSSTVARSTTRAKFGAASAQVTLPTNSTSSTVGVSYFQENPFYSLKPNTTYTASAYVYVPSATTNVRIVIQGSGRTSGSQTEATSVAKDQWVRIWNTFTTLSSGNVTVYVLNANSSTSGMQFWADGFMVTESSTPSGYADGDSPGWAWKGSNGTSQSKGPAL